MSRPILEQEKIHPSIQSVIAENNRDIVDEVSAAIAANDAVVVGMAQNPHVKRARKMLDKNNTAYKYLEYGSYFGSWRRRNALKMWTGWPTFPMVFIKGQLIGGADQLQELLENLGRVAEES